LADIEDRCFIPKQVQIKVLPIGRALLDEQKTFERNDNFLIIHEISGCHKMDRFLGDVTGVIPTYLVGRRYFLTYFPGCVSKGDV